MSTQEERLEEFIQKLKRIESEISLLTEEKKHLFDDFKEHFDPRVLREAIRQVKARLRLGDSVVQLDEIVEKLENTFTL